MPAGKSEQIISSVRFMALGILVLIAVVMLQLYQGGADGSGSPGAQALAREDTPESICLKSAALEQLLERIGASQHRIEVAMKNIEAMSIGLQREREDLESRLDSHDLEADASLLRGIEDVEAVKALAAANSASLQLIRKEAGLSVSQRKRLLIHPVIQMRGNGTVGSGVLVYSEPFAGEGPEAGYCNLALTAFHVVSEILGDRLNRKIDRVKLFSPGSRQSREVVSARLVAFDKSKDIALLRLDSKRKIRDVARLMMGSSLDRLDIFSPACAVGCPLGNSPVATLGQITAVDKEVEGERFWMINAPTYFGNSGGGVYSVPDCNLIGIFSMIYTYGKAKPMVVPHMGLFLPLDSISRWLVSAELGFVLDGTAVPSTAWKEMGYSPGNRPGEAGD